MILEVNIKLHLQPISLHDLVLLRLQLRHIPRTVDIPAVKPFALLCREPDDRVGRELIGLGEDGFQLVPEIIGIADDVIEDVSRVDCDGRDALWAILGRDELRDAQYGELGRLVGGDARRDNVSADAAWCVSLNVL